MYSSCGLPNWSMAGSGGGMKHVNALEIRNKLGEIIDYLEATGEPVLVSKGKRLRAVLITPEQFERRFVDYQAREKRRELLATIKSLRSRRHGAQKSLTVLRALRGYGA